MKLQGRCKFRPLAARHRLGENEPHQLLHFPLIQLLHRFLVKTLSRHIDPLYCLVGLIPDCLQAATKQDRQILIGRMENRPVLVLLADLQDVFDLLLHLRFEL